MCFAGYHADSKKQKNLKYYMLVISALHNIQKCKTTFEVVKLHRHDRKFETFREKIQGENKGELIPVDFATLDSIYI